ncbi:ribonuclease P [Caerostris darwini]|uniref:Mitochondrial ribonuclease P catalytic subunit n=1 Tax=Caerostris darwini TaxID=1538125 RepID=A0AAV4Q4T3_9ARAC|nr:ribonuclease P [Caerostris darwini]
MFALGRLEYRNFFRSKKVINQVSYALQKFLESCNPSQVRHKSHLTYKQKFKTHSLPSYKEGSFTSRYYQPSAIERTEDRIKEIISQKNIRTTEEWNDFKNELFIAFDILSEVNFSSVVMNNLLALNKVDEAHSFMKYLKEVYMEPNSLTYLQYMALCGNNIEQCGEELILQTFKKVKNYFDSLPVLDLKRTEYIIQGLSATSQWRDCFYYLKKLPCDWNCGVKNFVAAAAIKNGDKILAWDILSNWLENHETPNNKVLKEHILYAQRLQLQDSKLADDYITKFFQYVHQKGIIVDMEVLGFIEEYFKSHPDEWEMSHTKVSRGGECSSCKSHLKLVDLPEKDFIDLRNYFLQKSVMKDNLFINTTENEFNTYMKYINAHKPFEFVLDGLNAAHTMEDEHKNPKALALQLLKVLDRLSKFSDKILVLGREHMRSWPAPIMRKVSQRASVFLASNSSQDDPFMVYAALMSGPDSYIVSLDLMRDHIARLDNPKLIWLFKRWQQTHQIYFKAGENGKVRFIEPLRYSINIQGSMNDGWHIPYDDKIMLDPYEELNNWLCVHKKK